MAAKDVNGVLGKCDQWLTARKHSSTSPQQRYYVVKAIVEIIRTYNKTDPLPDSLVVQLVATAINEMTAITDFTSAWAKEACVLCVELCDVNPKIGCRALIDPIQSAALPHYFVMQALCDFAKASPAEVHAVPQGRHVEGTAYPWIGEAGQPPYRILQRTGRFLQRRAAAGNQESGPHPTIKGEFRPQSRGFWGRDVHWRDVFNE